MEENVPLKNADLLAKLQDLENHHNEEMKEQESVPLTNEDLLAKLLDLENRHSEELERLEQKIQQSTGTASKYLTLHKQVMETATSNTNEVKGDKEKLPESTASFFLVAKFPFIDGSQVDDDSMSGQRRTSVFLSVDLGSDDSETDTRASISKSALNTSSSCCPCVDWTKRDALFIPFWFAVFSLVLQLSTYFIALLNAADFTSKDDPFNIPIGVDPWTRAAELLAVAITVYSEQNFFVGLNLFGYWYSIRLVEEEKTFSWKCKFAAFTQVFVGIFGMGLTFLLIMQATDVVDLLLNFTAMEFVMRLDGILFKLATSGYIWSACEETAKLVSSSRFIFEKTEKNENRRRWLKRWPHLITLVVLYSLWGLLVYRQNNRKYGDNKVEVQFTDGVVPWLGTLSGTYVGRHLPFREKNVFGNYGNVGVIVYENEDQKRSCERSGTADGCKIGVFFYCQDVKEWRFDVVESTEDLNCLSWVLQGIHDEQKHSDRYDILSYSSAKWFARDPKAERTIALRDEITMIKSFEIEDYEGQEFDTLESSGILFHYPYYHRAEGIRIQDRPVYIASDGENGEFVAFNGYRWILVKYDDYECSSCGDDNDATNCFSECALAFDPFYSSYNASLISNPMTLQTSGDTWVPSDGLVWFTTKGQASETHPDAEEKLLPILVSENMLDNPEGLKDSSVRATANKIFAQSSRLSRSRTFERCVDDESAFTIELVTDLWPEETKMIMMELNQANPLFGLMMETEPSAASLLSALNEAGDFPTFVSNTFESTVALRETGTFFWDPERPHVFGLGKKPGEITTYRYGTCLPSSSCAAVLVLGKGNDVIDLPGRFEMYLDSKKVFDDAEEPEEYTYCMYQVGPNCDSTQVKCG